MRIFIVALVWFFSLGGLMLYMKPEGHVDYSEPHFQQFNTAEKVYTLEMTPSFIIEPDPFALAVDRPNDTPVMVIRWGEHEILKVINFSPGTDSFGVELSKGLLIGENEIYIEANPRSDQILTQNALRLQIIKNGYSIAEKTLWSPPGAKVSGTFQFTLNHDENNFSGKKHVQK